MPKLKEIRIEEKNIGHFLLLNILNIDTVLLLNELIYDFSNYLFDENLYHKIHKSSTTKMFELKENPVILPMV